MGISKEQFIAEVAAVYDNYSPNADVLAQVSTIDLTTISGPIAMGKDALIAESGLPRAIAETIRDPRMNNGVLERNMVEYEFRGHQLDEVLDDLRNGNHVQIGMGPGRDSFFGSRIANYPKSGPVLIDVMTDQARVMCELPFGSAESAFAVAPTYELWIQRLNSRGAISADEWDKRRKESVQSLTDGLEDERYVFILNDELSMAAKALYNLAVHRTYDKKDVATARNVAHSILKRIV